MESKSSIGWSEEYFTTRSLIAYILCTAIRSGENCPYLKEEREADPLVVGHVSALVLLVDVGRDDPGVRHLVAHVQRERPRDGVGAVDPAVEVEDVVGDVLGVDAVDGVADILPGRHDHGEGEEDHRADAPVQAEHGRVDVDVADLDQGLQPEEDVQHRSAGGGGRRRKETAARKEGEEEERSGPSRARTPSSLGLASTCAGGGGGGAGGGSASGCCGRGTRPSRGVAAAVSRSRGARPMAVSLLLSGGRRGGKSGSRKRRALRPQVAKSGDSAHPAYQAR